MSDTVSRLVAGEIGVMACDTIWGIVGRFGDEQHARICAAKERDFSKPLLVLCGDIAQLPDVVITPVVRDAMATYWPGPVTLIVPTTTGTIGCRVPAVASLRALLHEIGPLYSTSVNLSGDAPMAVLADLPDAIRDAVDFVDDRVEPPGGVPSRILDVTGQSGKWIR